jgi:uncharacterized protein
LKQVAERLWELQTIMSALAEKERALETKPEKFAEIDREYQAANSEMDAMTTRAAELEASRDAVDQKLQEQQESLKKYQGQLMQVKNQQQYAAAWKEIDTSRRTVKEHEDEFLRISQDLETVQAQLDARRSGHADLRDKFEEAYREWQNSLGALRSEVEKIREKASQVEQALPPNVRREFHRVLQGRGGVAVSEVDNGSCSQCRVHVRPQVMQQLKRGEIVTCEACRRFLWLEPVNA